MQTSISVGLIDGSIRNIGVCVTWNLEKRSHHFAAALTNEEKCEHDDPLFSVHCCLMFSLV